MSWNVLKKNVLENILKCHEKHLEEKTSWNVLKKRLEQNVFKKNVFNNFPAWLVDSKASYYVATKSKQSLILFKNQK